MYYIYITYTQKNDQPNGLTLAYLTCVDEGEKMMCIYIYKCSAPPPGPTFYEYI